MNFLHPTQLLLQRKRWHHLLLKLCELTGEVGHQLHGALQFLLQAPDLVLLPICIAAHQGHGSHPWEPVQIVLLVIGRKNVVKICLLVNN